MTALRVGAPPLVGISREQIAEHARRHGCLSIDEPGAVVCPCGACVAILCPSCDAPVFVAALPGSAPCEHLLELVGRRGGRR